jgi:hypothetical protein
MHPDKETLGGSDRENYRLRVWTSTPNPSVQIQYTDQEMIPARNARNVVTLAEVMFVTIQRENILPSKIADYWLLIN